MELDAEIAASLSWRATLGLPGLRDMTLSEAREGYDQAAAVLDPEEVAVGEVRDLEIAIEGTTRSARLYRPHGVEGEGPLLLWFHGGGWVQGSLRSHDRALRRLTEASGVRVLSVEYRLAPECPFPEGLNDAEALVAWTVAHAHELGALGHNIAVGGDSAGATLALVAALECARAGIRPMAQVLCYPSLGPELMTESHHDFDHDFGLSADDMAYFYELYLPAGQNHADPRVSPLLTPDLHEAPPAIIVVAGFDPLRDEGLAFAGLLEGSGVSVTLLDESSLTHGFLRLGGIPAARDAIGRLGDAIHQALC